MNTTRSGLSYSTCLGGSGADRGRRILVDGSGNAYVTGYTASTGFPTTTGALDVTHNGSDDMFVTKLNSSGSALLFSTFIGSTGTEGAVGVAVDQWGDIFVGGYSTGSFPTTTGAYDIYGNDDLVFAKLSACATSSPTSTAAAVVVYEPATIGRQPVGRTVQAGQSVTLSVGAGGRESQPSCRADLFFLFPGRGSDRGLFAVNT